MTHTGFCPQCEEAADPICFECWEHVKPEHGSSEDNGNIYHADCFYGVIEERREWFIPKEWANPRCVGV